MRLVLTATPGDRGARLELTKVVDLGAKRLPPSDPHFDPTSRSGTWVRLEDRSGTPLFTTQAPLIEESLEVPPGGDVGFTRILRCPGPTGISLLVPNLPEATTLVLFEEPIDGKLTFRTVELARVALPRFSGQ
jgi:hypothetical protein